MKSSYFSSLFNQDSADSVQELAETHPINTVNTTGTHIKSKNVEIKSHYKQSLTDGYTENTKNTTKKHRTVLAQTRVEEDTTQECFRDIFTNRLNKAARGLPVKLSELIYWFECDQVLISDYSITDKALRIGVASYVKYGLGRELRTASKTDHIDTACGMIRCSGCYYWLDDWCSNQEISTGARNTIDPQRLRRCKGFDRK